MPDMDYGWEKEVLKHDASRTVHGWAAACTACAWLKTEAAPPHHSLLPPLIHLRTPSSAFPAPRSPLHTQEQPVQNAGHPLRPLHPGPPRH